MLSRQRLITSFRNGIARPFFLKINKKHLELADSLIHLFQDSNGRRRFEIEEQISTFNIEKINPKVVQGLSELLYKRSSFGDPGAVNAVEIRKQLFTASANYWKKLDDNQSDILQHRKNILSASQLSPIESGTIEEHQLFGDIPANQKLTEFEPIQADALIHRFNIAQVQGLLLHARSLEVTINRQHGPALKQLMQMLKFFRLMFELTERDHDWITMKIDGPGAVLENSRSYGMEIAQFFPAVLLLTVPWRLTTQLKVPNRRRIFSLEITDDNSFCSHFQAQNTWTHEKTVILLNRFNEKYAATHKADSDREIIQLRDNRYLLPDFSVCDVNENKEHMQVEWIHYPSEGKLKWLRNVRTQLPENYVFAIKGKREKLKPLIKSMGRHLLVYTKDLTAPAIMKKFEADDR